MPAIRFCGASVMNFGSSIGWNGQPSTFRCSVVEDDTAGDVFLPPVTGTPIYFQFFGFKFFGILQSWRKTNSEQGFPTFDVEGISPTEILSGTQVITGGYAGTTSVVKNLINPFGYWESVGGYGASGSDQTGMPWVQVFAGINAIVNGNIAAFGGTLKWKGNIEYGIDLSQIPSPPSFYRVPVPNIDLLQLINTICEDCGYEWFLELVNGPIRPIIKIRTQSRRLQPPLGTIYAVTNTNWGNVMSSQSGLENRGDGITSSFVVGSNVQYLSETTNIVPYWGYDTNGIPILSTLEAQRTPPSPLRVENIRTSLTLVDGFITFFHDNHGLSVGNTIVIEGTRTYLGGVLQVPGLNGTWTVYDATPGVNGSFTLQVPWWIAAQHSVDFHVGTFTRITPLDAPRYVMTYPAAGPTGSFSSVLVVGGLPSVVVTTTLPHGLQNGDYISIQGVTGDFQEINGIWQVTVNNATTLLFGITRVMPPASTWNNSGNWFKVVQTKPMFVTTDLNATPISDIIGANYYHINEYELRAALAGEDTWRTYIANFRSWQTLRNLQLNNGHYQFDMGTRLGIVGIHERFSNIAVAIAQRNGRVPLRPQLPHDVLNDLNRNILAEAGAQLSDRDLKQKKVYQFVKFYAEEFYGKRFWVGVPFVLSKIDPFTSRLVHSQEVAQDGGWVEEGVNPLGLNALNQDFFKTQDGRFQSFFKWLGLIGSDLSSFDGTSTIVQGTDIFAKTQVSPEIVAIPSPAVLVTVSRPLYKQVENSYGDMGLLAAIINGTPQQVRQLVQSTAFAKLNLRIGPAVNWPVAATIPMKNTLLNYGPWYLSGPNGRVKYEHNDFAPWQFGSSGSMVAAALAKVTESVTFMQEGEAGSLELAGAPTIGLGDVLLSGGPNLTGIDVSYGQDGIKTSYKFRTYTPSFGSINRQTQDHIRRLGQNSFELRRNLRAAANRVIFQEERNAAGRAAIAWMNDVDRQRRRADRTPHNMISAATTPDYMFYDEDCKRVSAATMTVDEVFEDLGEDDFKDSLAISSLSAIVRPICTAEGENENLSSYTDPSGEFENTTLNSVSLNPFKGHNDNEMYLYGATGYDGLHQFRNNPDTSANRVIGLRGPIVMSGWGWDIEGYPVPNALDEDDERTTDFVENYQKKSHLWPAGPHDALWDHKRGVWTSHDLLLGKLVGNIIPAKGVGQMEVYGPDGSGTGWVIDVHNWFNTSVSGEGLEIMAGYFVTANKWFVIAADCV